MSKENTSESDPSMNSRSNSSARSSPAIMSSQSSFSDQRSIYSSSESAELICPDFAEELFPVDTVKQIYDDIEKLFTDAEESAKLANSAIGDKSTYHQNKATNFNISKDYQKKYLSRQANFMLDQIVSDYQENYLSVAQYVYMCSVELNSLDKQLTYKFSKNNFATKLSTETNPFANSDIGQLPAVCKLEVNDLHNMIWKLFNMQDKLTEFLQNLTNNSSPSGKLLSSYDKEMKFILDMVIEEWHALALTIKDMLIATNNPIEVYSILSSSKQVHLQPLLALTRQLRTFLWML